MNIYSIAGNPFTFTMNQYVATTDSPTFVDLTLTGDLTLAGDLTLTGDIVADSGRFDGGILSTGAITGFTIPSGAGTRLMWIPLRQAFRAGQVTGTEWDAANVGLRSFATGTNTTASGISSFAAGSSATASGNISFATGSGVVASGVDSFATGLGTKALGDYSFIAGHYARASGTGSFAVGYNTDPASPSLVAGTGVANVGYGQIVMGYASTGHTLTAEGTGSIAMGQDVNALTNPNVIVFGRHFSTDVQDSFSIGFGQLDYSFTATAADFNDSSLTANNFISDVATGTSPYACTSTTLNDNLNAGLLDGQHGAYYAAAASYVPYTGATTTLELGVYGIEAAAVLSNNFDNADGDESLIWADGDDWWEFSNDLVVSGAITGTSFTIAAHTLEEAEFHYLDGQDQAVKTTSDSTFAHITSSYSGNSVLSGISTVQTLSGLNGQGVQVALTGTKGDTNTQYLYGMNYQVVYNPTGAAAARTCTALTGALGLVQATLNASESYAHKVTNAYGYKGSILISEGAGVTGSMTIASAYGFYSSAATKSTNGVITSLYSFYDAGQTVGVTNWGFGINTQSYINASLSIGKNTAPTVALDVVGAGLFSTSLTAGTGFGCNSKTAQTAYTVNADCTDLPTVVALCNQIRAALVANGICV